MPTKIITKPSTPEYRENFEKAFWSEEEYAVSEVTDPSVICLLCDYLVFDREDGAYGCACEGPCVDDEGLL